MRMQVVPFDPPQYAQISDVQMAAGHEVGDEREPESFGWDVTVVANSGVADGSVQLTFADGADIRDLAGNAANLDGVTSTSVTLDNVLPVISAEVMSVGGDDIISKADLDTNQPVVVKVIVTVVSLSLVITLSERTIDATVGSTTSTV